MSLEAHKVVFHTEVWLPSLTSDGGYISPERNELESTKRCAPRLKPTPLSHASTHALSHTSTHVHTRACAIPHAPAGPTPRSHAYPRPISRVCRCPRAAGRSWTRPSRRRILSACSPTSCTRPRLWISAGRSRQQLAAGPRRPMHHGRLGGGWGGGRGGGEGA